MSIRITGLDCSLCCEAGYSESGGFNLLLNELSRVKTKALNSVIDELNTRYYKLIAIYLEDGKIMAYVIDNYDVKLINAGETSYENPCKYFEHNIRIATFNMLRHLLGSDFRQHQKLVASTIIDDKLWSVYSLPTGGFDYGYVSVNSLRQLHRGT